MATKRQLDDIFKMLKGKNFQPRNLYPTKLSFKNEGGVKTFPYKQRLRKLITTSLALKEILNTLAEMK